jgi:heme exporter protein D
MMDEATERKDWALTGVCIGLSGFGLSAVPFVGTKYGDWPEAMALGVGLLPLIYITIHTVMRFKERLRAIEDRLTALERSRAPSHRA